MDHEVLDCPRMIANLERMNMEQVDPEKGQENETLAEPQKETKTILLHMKETLNDHQDTNLSKILKEKEQIEVR